MNRRSFIKAATSFGTAAILPGISLAQTGCPAGVKIEGEAIEVTRQDTLRETLPLLYRQSPITLLGHHMHSDPLPLIFPFGADHIRVMVETGKKHLVLEFPVALQSLFDGISDGSRSMRELAATMIIPWLKPRENMAVMMNIGRGLPAMRAQGIQVHCVDTGLTEVSMEDIKALNDYLTGKGPENKEANQRILAARMDDRQRLALIDERTKRESCLALLGAMHLQDHEHSIKSLLGGTNGSTHINLYGSQSLYSEAHEKYCHYTGDYAALIEEDKILQTGNKALPLKRNALLENPVPAPA